MKKLVIIKFGGSVITDKGSNSPIFKESVVKRLAKEVKDIIKKNYQVILVHGGGSFAHPIARKYRLNEGIINSQSPKGVSLCKQAVLHLNNLFISELLKAGINSCLVETSAVAINRKMKIKMFNTAAVKTILNNNLVPVLSGDVVIDEDMGVSILSGDQIVVYLAKKMDAAKIIFVSDVDGVFDKNPKLNKSAKLIKLVNSKNFKSVLKDMQSSNINDVTGEMKGKILSIHKSLKNTQVIITNGLKKNNLRNSILGKHNGTEINFN